MNRVLIDYADYCEETNDPQERRVCKMEGPRYRDEDGYFRVPRTGFVRNGVEYQLRGFGKLDRKPGPKIEIPQDVTEWFEKRMGHAYVPYFIRDRDLRLRVSIVIKNVGWVALQHRIEQNLLSLPIVKAIHLAVEQSPGNIRLPDEPTGSSITENDMEDMFK